MYVYIVLTFPISVPKTITSRLNCSLSSPVTPTKFLSLYILSDVSLSPLEYRRRGKSLEYNRAFPIKRKYLQNKRK